MGMRRVMADRDFDFNRQVVVMAVVNRTRDSFFDRGRTFAHEQAVDAAVAAWHAGAEWVDIGGVPFSPDAEPVDAAQEYERVVPVVAELASRTQAVISVDTWRASVAEAALNAGAHVINDTSGLFDPELAPVVAEKDAHLICTHSLAAPRQHLYRPTYRDVVDEVRASLDGLVTRAIDAGIDAERLFLDPGPDLNKNTTQTLELCRRFSEICDLGFPTLVAASNKDFIGETLGRPKSERGPGSLAAAVWCVSQGGRILRMHDAASAVDAARMCEAILGWREPEYLRHNV